MSSSWAVSPLKDRPRRSLRRASLPERQSDRWPGHRCRVDAAQRLSSGLAAVLGRVAGEGHQMSAFIAELENHPGELARLCEAMASSGVNLLRPALTVRMENLPGAGAATFRKLADAGVNVELLLPVRISDEEFFAVICADDAAAAEAAVGGQVIS